MLKTEIFYTNDDIFKFVNSFLQRNSLEENVEFIIHINGKAITSSSINYLNILAAIYSAIKEVHFTYCPKLSEATKSNIVKTIEEMKAPAKKNLQPLYLKILAKEKSRKERGLNYLDLTCMDLNDNTVVLFSQYLIALTDRAEEIDNHSPNWFPQKIILSNNPLLTDRSIQSIVEVANLNVFLKDVELEQLINVNDEVKKELNYVLREMPGYDKAKLSYVRKIANTRGDIFNKIHRNWAIVRIWSPETLNLKSLLKRIINPFQTAELFEEDPSFTTNKIQLLISGKYLGQWGHVSLLTSEQYVSLWPDLPPNTPLSEVPSYFNTLENDFEWEDKVLPKCIIVLHIFNTQEMVKEFRNLECEYKLANGGKTKERDPQKEMHNCSSIIIKLLRKGIDLFDPLMDEIQIHEGIQREQLKKEMDELKNALMKELDKLNNTTISPNDVAHVVTLAKELEIIFFKLVGFTDEEIANFDRLPSKFFLREELDARFLESEPQQITTSVITEPVQQEVKTEDEFKINFHDSNFTYVRQIPANFFHPPENVNESKKVTKKKSDASENVQVRENRDSNPQKSKRCLLS